jgi:hypothetical protein
VRCEDLRQELTGLATGDLVPDRRQVVEEHLAICSACSGELEEIRHTIEMARVAPLQEDVPERLERETFGFVELEPVTSLVSGAPLRHEPPLPLEGEALTRSGAFAPQARFRGWQRLAPVVAPGLAASLLILGFLGASWYSDAADARQRLSRVEDRFGPWGDMVKRLELTPLSQATPALPSVEAELMRLPHDHYGLVLHLEDYPPTPQGYVCQLWLVGERGERTPLGGFTVPGGNETRTFQIDVPVDPRDFPKVEVTLEPLNGDEGMQGLKIMEATLDF